VITNLINCRCCKFYIFYKIIKKLIGHYHLKRKMNLKVKSMAQLEMRGDLIRTHFFVNI